MNRPESLKPRSGTLGHVKYSPNPDIESFSRFEPLTTLSIKRVTLGHLNENRKWEFVLQ